MGQYEGGTNFGKTAGVNDTITEESFSKFASENPELVKQAMELGYRETKAQLEKVAESATTKATRKLRKQLRLQLKIALR